MEFLYETIRFNVKSPIMDSLFLTERKIRVRIAIDLGVRTCYNIIKIECAV